LALLVDIKWNKEQFKGVEVDLSEDVDTFRAQIYAMTSVPPAGQKVMIGGRPLKDDADLSKVAGLKNNAKILLVGTQENQGLREPEKPIVFLEEMTPEQRAIALSESAAVVVPPGMVNLGNTCYMNSVAQCFNRIPELRDALLKYQPPQEAQNQHMQNLDSMMAAGGRVLMTEFKQADKSFPPFQFWAVLK
jgi:ubiquitin carboxyl-terminal hydrolase 14